MRRRPVHDRNLMSSLSVYCVALICLVHVIQVTDSENTRQNKFLNGPCLNSQYRCFNNKCIPRGQHCDGVNQCGDYSDENYCDVEITCPTSYPGQLTCCETRRPYYPYSNDYDVRCKCIPIAWKCDGIQDCVNGSDEKECDFSVSSNQITSSHLVHAAKKARDWILSKRNKERSTRKWGSDLPRIAAALYLSEPEGFRPGKGFADEIIYELSLSFLSRLVLRKMGDISTPELASYVNAFLVTCLDPRRYHVVDLVKELRSRVDAQNSTNPYAMLALCNAKDEISQRDVEKLKEIFWKAQQKYRTATQALAVIALACAASQSQELFDPEKFSDLTVELKQRQYRNGTVENIKTTALVMQALFASKSQTDEDDFDVKKAFQQILRSQLPDGSFGDIANTYFVLPVLSYSTLANISAAHCTHFTKDENEVIQYLRNQAGDKNNITFSVWIGDDKVVQRSLAISVPKNTSFYGVMEYAADLDEKFRFEYVVRERKPYITALSGLMDDPEMDTFWLPFQYSSESDKELKPISTSPADVIPENSDHLVFWYRKDA